MAQHTYDEESVQELLGWAKKMLETKSYPTEKYQVNACTSIIDGKLYLESLISMIFVPIREIKLRSRLTVMTDSGYDFKDSVSA